MDPAAQGRSHAPLIFGREARRPGGLAFLGRQRHARPPFPRTGIVRPALGGAQAPRSRAHDAHRAGSHTASELKRALCAARPGLGASVLDPGPEHAAGRRGQIGPWAEGRLDATRRADPGCASESPGQRRMRCASAHSAAVRRAGRGWAGRVEAQRHGHLWVHVQPFAQRRRRARRRRGDSGWAARASCSPEPTCVHGRVVRANNFQGTSSQQPVRAPEEARVGIASSAGDLAYRGASVLRQCTSVLCTTGLRRFGERRTPPTSAHREDRLRRFASWTADDVVLGLGFARSRIPPCVG